jgi:hypothetical protein
MKELDELQIALEQYYDEEMTIDNNLSVFSDNLEEVEKFYSYKTKKESHRIDKCPVRDTSSIESTFDRTDPYSEALSSVVESLNCIMAGLYRAAEDSFKIKSQRSQIMSELTIILRTVLEFAKRNHFKTLQNAKNLPEINKNIVQSAKTLLRDASNQLESLEPYKEEMPEEFYLVTKAVYETLYVFSAELITNGTSENTFNSRKLSKILDKLSTTIRKNFYKDLLSEMSGMGGGGVSMGGRTNKRVNSLIREGTSYGDFEDYEEYWRNIPEEIAKTGKGPVEFWNVPFWVGAVFSIVNDPGLWEDSENEGRQIIKKDPTAPPDLIDRAIKYEKGRGRTNDMESLYNLVISNLSVNSDHYKKLNEIFDADAVEGPWHSKIQNNRIVILTPDADFMDKDFETVEIPPGTVLEIKKGTEYDKIFNNVRFEFEMISVNLLAIRAGSEDLQPFARAGDIGRNGYIIYNNRIKRYEKSYDGAYELFYDSNGNLHHDSIPAELYYMTDDLSRDNLQDHVWWNHGEKIMFVNFQHETEFIFTDAVTLHTPESGKLNQFIYYNPIRDMITGVASFGEKNGKPTFSRMSFKNKEPLNADLWFISTPPTYEELEKIVNKYYYAL